MWFIDRDTNEEEMNTEEKELEDENQEPSTDPKKYVEMKIIIICIDPNEKLIQIKRQYGYVCKE